MYTKSITTKDRIKPGPVRGKSYEKSRARLQKETLKIHYEWCKKEGRDISWYE